MNNNNKLVSSICICCRWFAQPCLTLCDTMDCSTPGFPVLHCLPQFAQTHVDWVDDAIQSSHPLSFPSYPAFNLSQHQGLFQWVVLCIQWPQFWSFSFSSRSSNEYSRLISFRIDWFDLFAVQGTLKSLPQDQFENINYLTLSLLCGPTLTSIHDYWKSHSFDYTDFC